MTKRQFALGAALALAVPLPARPGSSTVPRNPRTTVTSTSLASIGYEQANSILEIEFRSGAIYRYLSVPARVHRELMSAESKGRYFSQQIRGHYRFHRIAEDKP